MSGLGIRDYRIPPPDVQAASDLIAGSREQVRCGRSTKAGTACGQLKADTRPDLWQYGCPDPDEGPDAVMIFDGEPRHISPRYLRRPMRAVGPWVPVPTTGEQE